MQEVNDEETLNMPTLKINSHWNSKSCIVIGIKEEFYTVDGQDLKTAIDNAMNAGG